MERVPTGRSSRKRRRTGALQNLADSSLLFDFAKRLGEQFFPAAFPLIEAAGNARRSSRTEGSDGGPKGPTTNPRIPPK